MAQLDTNQEIELDGEKYYTINKFAELSGKHYSRINKLLNHGNKERKLEHIRVGGKPFIKATELENYPFTIRGEN